MLREMLSQRFGSDLGPADMSTIHGIVGTVKRAGQTWFFACIFGLDRGILRTQKWEARRPRSTILLNSAEGLPKTTSDSLRRNFRSKCTLPSKNNRVL